jgi:hypothetical protein
MSFKQLEAENGGQQLLYHGRTWDAGVWPVNCETNPPLLPEEKICTQRWVRILLVMGRAP